MSERIDALRAAAHDMHAGQVDKSGAPYAAHLDAVAAGVSEPAVPVALFHDAIEDGRATRDDLRALLTPVELAAVELLTRSDQPYADYILQIKGAAGPAAELAREVKLSDLRHNHGRLTADLERLRERYESALAVLAG